MGGGAVRFTASVAQGNGRGHGGDVDGGETGAIAITANVSGHHNMAVSVSYT